MFFIWCSDSLRAGRSGDRIPKGARFSAPGHRFSAPVQRFSAPVQRFSASIRRFSSPVHRFSASVQRFSAPVQRFSATVQRFSAPVQRFSAPVQTGSAAHPASCTMGTGSFLGVKRPRRDVDHPLPSSAEVKDGVELYLYSPSGSSWPVLGRTYDWLPLDERSMLSQP